MVIEIDQDNLKKGILSLVMALVEIIKDALRLQALKRMDGDTLTAEEIERLGRALIEIDRVIDEIKSDCELVESVGSIRDSLDRVAADVIDNFMIASTRDPSNGG